jgi:hypothetical protein
MRRLIAAVLELRMAVANERRTSMLLALDEDCSLRDLVEAYVLPLANGFLPGPRTADRVPADWTDVPHTRISLAPVAPTIGAVVDGVDLAGPVDASRPTSRSTSAAGAGAPVTSPSGTIGRRSTTQL